MHGLVEHSEGDGLHLFRSVAVKARALQVRGVGSGDAVRAEVELALVRDRVRATSPGAPATAHVVALADPVLHERGGLLDAGGGDHLGDDILHVLGVPGVEPALEGGRNLVGLSVGTGEHVGPVVLGVVDLDAVGLLPGVGPIPYSAYVNTQYAVEISTGARDRAHIHARRIR